MSKSNSLNRNNSTEVEPDGILKDPIAAIIMEEENRTHGDINNAHLDNATNHNQDPNDNEAGGGKEVMPASPPPSYEFVLEETRLKQQESIQSDQSPSTPPKAQEIMHTSSKEFYKAVAKQFGITCKMSDHCRCYDCQSHYFDCEYEQNEQEKTDGGLGAGTPVFLHEVMHGSACSIL